MSSNFHRFPYSFSHFTSIAHDLICVVLKIGRCFDCSRFDRRYLLRRCTVDTIEMTLAGNRKNRPERVHAQDSSGKKIDSVLFGKLSNNRKTNVQMNRKLRIDGDGIKG